MMTEEVTGSPRDITGGLVVVTRVNFRHVCPSSLGKLFNLISSVQV